MKLTLQRSCFQLHGNFPRCIRLFSISSRGYFEIFRELEKSLCSITDLMHVHCNQTGAQGEYGMVIRAYHHDSNESFRNIALIPSSAHGTILQVQLWRE